MRLVNTVTLVVSFSCRTTASLGCTVGGARFPPIRGIGAGIVPSVAIEGNDWSVYRAIFLYVCKSAAKAAAEFSPEDADFLEGLRHASREA